MSAVKNRIFTKHRGGIVLREIYRFIFKLAGWRTVGSLPQYKKYIIIVAPHTSNWDFLLGLGSRAVYDFNPRYVGKKELFVWPLGGLFRKLGGYPVERKKNSNFVQSIVEIFNKEEEFILTITPEGTRSYNDNWKTGFYYIAKELDIPIIPVAFDYKNKQVIMGDVVRTTKEVEEVVSDLKVWYSQFEGKNPENGVR